MKEDMLSRKVVFMFTISTVENVTRVILKDKRCVQRSFYVAYISRVKKKASRINAMFREYLRCFNSEEKKKGHEN